MGFIPTFFCKKLLPRWLLFKGVICVVYIYDHDLITPSPYWFYTKFRKLEKKSCDKPKVSYFFFPGKVGALLTNSFSDKTVFFFRFFGKKNSCFFFSLEKFDRDSLVIQLTLVKYFPIIHWVNLPNFTKSRFWGCFFFFPKSVFFFSGKVRYALTYSN